MYICYKNNDVEWLSCVYGLHVGNRTLRTINNGNNEKLNVKTRVSWAARENPLLSCDDEHSMRSNPICNNQRSWNSKIAECSSKTYLWKEEIYVHV